MKTGTIPMYGVYKDDELIAKGSSQELSEKFYVVQGVIPTCAKYGRKLLREYRVERLPEIWEDEESKRLNERIRELWNTGMRQTQIAQKLHTTIGTVNGRVRLMRKRGEL